MTLPESSATASLSLLADEHAHGGNGPAELILVFLLLLVVWALFRITGKKRQG